MLTALAGDDLATARRRAEARIAAEAFRTATTHDLLDQFADLTHAAQAAAQRADRAA